MSVKASGNCSTVFLNPFMIARCLSWRSRFGARGTSLGRSQFQVAESQDDSIMSGGFPAAWPCFVKLGCPWASCGWMGIPAAHPMARFLDVPADYRQGRQPGRLFFLVLRAANFCKASRCGIATLYLRGVHLHRQQVYNI